VKERLLADDWTTLEALGAEVGLWKHIVAQIFWELFVSPPNVQEHAPSPAGARARTEVKP
jgi:hypothetical protein